MEMMDMGHKVDTGLGPSIAESSKGKNKISYPGFSITENIPEELANAKVGDMMRCEIIVKKVGDSIETYNESKPRVEMEVYKLGCIGKAGKISKEEYFAKSDEDRAKYDKEQMDMKEDKGEGKDEEAEGSEE